MIPFSVLDLSNVAQGATVADALYRSRELAQHAERLGYRRYWLAEHHNMPGIASAATAVVIDSTMRVVLDCSGSALARPGRARGRSAASAGRITCSLAAARAMVSEQLGVARFPEVYTL